MSRFLPAFPDSTVIRRYLLDYLSKYPTRKCRPEHRISARARIGASGLGLERAIVGRRSAACAAALSRFAGPLASSPRIGVALSGGGYRALIGGLGSIRGLDSIGLLDSTHLISSLSGSSWLIAMILQKLKTSNNRRFNSRELTKLIKQRVNQPLFAVSASSDYIQSEIAAKLQRVFAESKQSESFDISLIELFSLALGDKLLGGTENPIPALSDQREAIEGANFPFPLYTAINHQSIQFEFSPVEVGSAELNYFIPSWAFGRKFDAGISIPSEQAETSLALLLAVFGSAHCVSADRILEELSYAAKSTSPIIERLRPILFGQLKLGSARPFAPQPFPNPLARFGNSPLSSDAEIRLLDAGTAFNIPFTPLIQPSRELDLILVFDYSSPPEAISGIWLKRASDYAKFHNLPFPDLENSIQIGKQVNQTAGCAINANPLNNSSSANQMSNYVAVTNEQLNLQRVMSNTLSIFPGNVNKKIPTILYFPLIHDSNYNQSFDPRQNFLNGEFCSTLNFKYSNEQVDLLSGLTQFAVESQQNAIKSIIQHVANEKAKAAAAATAAAPSAMENK